MKSVHQNQSSSHDEIKIYSMHDSAEEAIRRTKVFGGGRPDTIFLGLEPIDTTIGGLDPMTGGVLLMDQGVGKTNTILYSAVHSPEKVGIISTEDGPTLVGSRLLAMVSGVNPRKMRLGLCDDDDREAIATARSSLEGESGVSLVYAIGQGLDYVLDAVHLLCEQGCRLIWLDYVQKVRGVSDDRRNEVARVYTAFQGAAAKHGAASMVASQVTGVEEGEMPTPANARETRDIVNEARLIIAGCKAMTVEGRVVFKVLKNSFGEAGQMFRMQFDGSGTLHPVTF